MSDLQDIDRRLTELRQDYDRHLVFGKWGSIIAIGIFLTIFAFQSAVIFYLVGHR